MFSSIANKSSFIPRLTDFLAWWSGELAGLLPAFIKSFFQGESYQVRVDKAAGKISLLDVVKDKVLGEYAFDQEASELPRGLSTAMASLDTAKLETLLMLDPSDVLLLDVTLPAEAREDLDKILGYEMDRQTPFKPDQVYYDYQVEKSPLHAKQILVKLVVVPRELVKQGLRHLENRGLRATVITAIGKNTKGLPLKINLLPADLRPVQPQGIKRLNWLLLASVIIMLLAAVAIAINKQETAISSLKRQIASVSNEVHEVQNITRKIDQLFQDASQIIDTKLQSPGVIGILNDLSALIPDHTSLLRFELKGNNINLQGESDNASELIGLIETSGKFQNASFTSPVVRDARSGRDRFQLRANLTVQDAAP